MADPKTDKAAAEAFTKELASRGPDPHKRDGSPRCAAKVWAPGAYRSYQCEATGKVVLADGSTWCGTHSPEAVERREEKRRARWAQFDADLKVRMDANEVARRRAADYPKLRAALQAIADGHNDPRALAATALKETSE